MKLNKTLMMTALVVGSLWTGSMALQAQDSTSTNSATPAPQRPRMGSDGLMKSLGLTDDQKTKAKPVFDDMMTQMRSLRGDTTLSPTDKRAKMKQIRDDATTKLKDILTPDQLAKWQKMGPGSRRPPAPPSADGSAPAAPPAAPTPQQ